ncbi:MAG TPA: formate dehydrogenase subunit alpha [Lentisphaeria bacterium]|nr:MAG: formate dehydrogenase subunit alpha [Lentisphaerae bacterium GWF2_38_69]HBM15085.1 formate dehydrogenase subunit alpha [Lentisphaeria bacterium]
MNDIIKIFIDGREIEACQGEKILDAALRNNINIPNLCYDKKLSCTGSCRMCIVSIEDRPVNVPACSTVVENGMKIIAFNDKLEAERKVILDLILSMHNDDCINCVKDGSCDLQDLAFRYDLGRGKRTFHPMWGDAAEYSDSSSQVLNYDATKCIQCQKCIKACQEIQGKGILTLENRGIEAVVSTGYNQWSDSKCDGCGECAQVCPVGALTMKFVYTDGKRFRDKDISKITGTTCPYCGVGCQLDVHTNSENQIIKVTGSESLPNLGSTCVKGRFGLQYSGHKERLKSPMIRRGNSLVECSWNEALAFTAEKLKEIKSIHGGADMIAGMSSARCTNEDNYLFQKFMRTVIGTNNVDHCARICHGSTVASMLTSLGSGAMTNAIADFEKADVIFVTGSNTTETHPVIATAIKRAVLNNNARLIVADPRKIDLVRYAAVWMKQKNGTDIALANGLIHVILKESLQKDDFIKNRTEGFEELKKSVEKYTPEYVEKITGVPADKIIEAARIYGTAQRASIAWTMGITQHACGTDNVTALTNLAVITGNIGREGTGLNPLRGQNNVQGACDMGAQWDSYPGYFQVENETAKNRFESLWKTKLSSKNGIPLTEIMDAVLEGRLKSLYIMGENPAVSEPDLNHTVEALKSLDLLIVQDIFLNETAQYAHVVFPAASALEKNGTFTNTERRVIPVRKVLNMPGQAKEDWEIIQDLAAGMGYFWNYRSWEDIMKEINLVVPQYSGITPERINKGELIQWPCPDSKHPGTSILHGEKFTRGKALLQAVEHIPPAEETSEEYPFVLSTGRNLFHYHTGTMTRKSIALNSFCSDPYFEMNEDDMRELAINEGEKVKILSRRGEIIISARSSKRVEKENLFLPFHFAEAAANMLTINALDPKSKMAELKVCAVNIKRL